MSSSGLGYIGSKLSLISKSNVRYVGILNHIDTINSSIALVQVQSFGSEGRRIAIGEEEIGPSNNIFDYILFHGSDIKDLQVYEPPPPPLSTNINPTEYVPHPYPTPMYSSYPITYYRPYQPPQPSSSFIITQKPQVPDHHHHEALNRSYFQEESNPKVLINNSNNDDDDTPKISVPSNFMSSENSTALDRSLSKPNVKDSPLLSSKEKSNDIISATINDIVKSVDELKIGKASPSSAHSIINKKQQRQQYHHHQYHHQYHDHHDKMNRYVNTKSKYKRYPKNNDDITNLKEFDFESSNSKFNKEDIQQDATTFYDKKKSFFDNISCDAKEKSETSNKDHYRKKYLDEKLLNMETFGQVSVEKKRKYSTRRSNNYHHHFNKK